MKKLRIVKKSKNEPRNIWEYAEWLYNSNRLTTQEYLDLKKFAIELAFDIREDEYSK